MTKYGISDVVTASDSVIGLQTAPGVVSVDTLPDDIKERLTGDPSKKKRGRPKKEVVAAVEATAKAVEKAIEPVPTVANAIPHGLAYTYWLFDDRRVLVPYPAIVIRPCMGDLGRYDLVRFIAPHPCVVPVYGAPMTAVPTNGAFTKAE